LVHIIQRPDNQPITETRNAPETNKYVNHSRDSKYFHHWMCGKKNICAWCV